MFKNIVKIQNSCFQSPYKNILTFFQIPYNEKRFRLFLHTSNVDYVVCIHHRGPFRKGVTTPEQALKNAVEPIGIFYNIQMTTTQKSVGYIPRTKI